MSPPPAPRCQRKSALLRAIHTRSTDAVVAVLEAEPEAVWSLRLDRGRDETLIYALQSGCGVGVVEVLLQHGADVSATDPVGLTPLASLSNRARACSWAGAPAQAVEAQREAMKRDVDVARALVKAGALPAAQDWQNAQATGNFKLASFLQFGRDARACAILRCDALHHSKVACSCSCGPIVNLSADLLCVIELFLVPAHFPTASSSSSEGCACKTRSS